jgi:hypothetical protein
VGQRTARADGPERREEGWGCKRFLTLLNFKALRHTRVADLFHMDYVNHVTRAGGTPGPNNWARWENNGFEFQIPRKQ